MKKFELTDEIKISIQKYCDQYRLDPLLIRAIIETESDYNPMAFRFEPNFRWLYSDKELAGILGCNRDTMRAIQSVSYGLMQVMGSVCYEYGFREWPGHLFNVDLNIRYGCQHVKNLMMRKKLTEAEEIYDAYNSGRADPNDGNQGNVRRFMKIHERILRDSGMIVTP